jgi:hypothetical protein
MEHGLNYNKGNGSGKMGNTRRKGSLPMLFPLIAIADTI